MQRILSLILLCSLAFSAIATPVGPLNYQGRLLDSNGIPVTGSFNFIVKIYNDPTAGVLKYQETLNSVPVDDGVYSFKIGLGPKTGGDSLWDIALWQGNLNDLYLELTVNGDTMTSRHELTSAPHAFTSTFALSADALGNKTAAQFDNVLEGICVISKGKWLDKLGQCLGRGAVIQNQTLTTMLNTPSDTNFTNLDLSGADLTGTNFTGVNFTGTTFSSVTFSPQHFGGTNLNNTVWDSAIPVGVLNSLPASAAGAHFIGTDVSGLRFSQFTLSTQYKNIVIAYMNACPAAISRPPSWGCYDHISNASKKLLAGPHGNYSASSPLAAQDYMGRNKLDVAWYIYLTDVTNSLFDGAYITSWNAPEDGYFSGSSFRDTYFYGSGIYFSYMSFNNSDFTNATFDRIGNAYMVVTGANLTNSHFNGFGVQLSFSGAANLQSATIENMNISTNVAGSYLNLNSAIVRNLVFDGIANLSSNSARYENIYFTGPVGNGAGGNAFVSAKFFGDVKLSQTVGEPMTISGSTFYGSNMKGTYAGVTFTGNTFDNVNFSQGNFQGATFTGNTITNPIWTGARCPNGIIYPGGGHNCPP